MISRQTVILRHIYRHAAWNCRTCTSSVRAAADRDPAPFFFNQDVQQILKTLTRVDYQEVFKARKTGQRLTPPQFQFMTDEELKVAIDEAKTRGEKILQIPPFVKPVADEPKILSDDPALQGFDEEVNYAFTDITYGIKNKGRLIVIREPNGVLREAGRAERQRLNQIYFPMAGRQMETPKLFEDENFNNLLDQREYVYLLDRACAQFEPDDPEFRRITADIYNRVNQMKDFNSLRSTRHFGSLTFYLVWSQDIDNLLLEMVETHHVDEALLLLQLYRKVHPDTEIAKEADGKDVDSLLRYAEISKKGRIKRAVLAYKELQAEKQKVTRGIRRAHGFHEPTDESGEPK